MKSYTVTLSNGDTFTRKMTANKTTEEWGRIRKDIKTTAKPIKVVETSTGEVIYTAPDTFQTPEIIDGSFNFAPLRICAIALGKIGRITEIDTFKRISREFSAGVSAVRRFISAKGTDPEQIDLFIDSFTLPRYDTEVNEEGEGIVKKTFPAIFSSDTAECFSYCRAGYIFPDTPNPTEEDRRKNAYKELNRYLWKQRSNRAREVMTPYTYEQIETAIGENEQGQTFEKTLFEVTDTTWKKTVRRIFEGLTEHEQEKGVEDIEDKVLLAVREVSQTFTPRQVQIAERLGRGEGVHKIANDLYRTDEQKKQGKRADTKTVKEHKERIEKKLSANPIIAEELKKTRREKDPAPVITPDLLDFDVIPTDKVIEYLLVTVRVGLAKTPDTFQTFDPFEDFAPVPAESVWNGKESNTLFEQSNRTKGADTAEEITHRIKQVEYNNLFALPAGDNPFEVSAKIALYVSIRPADYTPTPIEYIKDNRNNGYIKRFGRPCPDYTAPAPAPIRRPCKAQITPRPEPQTRPAPKVSAWKTYTDKVKNTKR